MSQQSETIDGVGSPDVFGALFDEVEDLVEFGGEEVERGHDPAVRAQVVSEPKAL